MHLVPSRCPVRLSYELQNTVGKHKSPCYLSTWASDLWVDSCQSDEWHLENHSPLMGGRGGSEVQKRVSHR